jgi:ADP-heptose:LPS heptosyltransferase
VILVLRALGLGDLLTALPALRGLREAFPDERVVLAAPAVLAPLALHARAVDEVVATTPWKPLPTRVRGADLAVNLHGRGPESHRLLLAAEPRRLVAFAHAEVPESAGGPPHSDEEHEVVRWCRLLHEHGIAADPARLELHSPGPPPATAVRGATVVHPGAASRARRWPADRFAAVARSEHAGGRHVVITGGADERPLAAEVARLAGLPLSSVLAGRTDLLGLVSTVAGAARVVCGDTGVAHLATALGTPSVVLFGPTSPQHWGPPPDRPQHRILWAGRAGDPHADEPFAGLVEIGVCDVVGELARLDATAAAA